MNEQMKFDYAGTTYRVSVEYDNDPQNPRDEDNLGTMIYSHKNMKLGDEIITTDQRLKAEDRCLTKNGRLTTEGVFEELALMVGAAFWLPLNYYEHGPQCTMGIGTGSDWDNGPVGIIYITEEKLKHEYGDDYDGYIKKMWPELTTEQKVEGWLESEVQTFAWLLEQETYGFNVEVLTPFEGEVCDCDCGKTGCNKASIPEPTWKSITDADGMQWGYIGPASHSGMQDAILWCFDLYDTKSDRRRHHQRPHPFKNEEAEAIFKKLTGVIH